MMKLYLADFFSQIEKVVLCCLALNEKRNN